MLDSLWTSVTGDKEYDLHDRRVTVLTLHMEEMAKQAEVSAKELAAAKATIADYDAKAKARGPMERKLFAKLEATQLELRKAREAKRAAEARAEAQASRQASSEPPPGVAAAAGSSDDPSAGLLARASGAQLQAAKALHRDAAAEVSELELRVGQAEAARRAAEEAAATCAAREAETERRLGALRTLKSPGACCEQRLFTPAAVSRRAADAGDGRVRPDAPSPDQGRRPGDAAPHPAAQLPARRSRAPAPLEGPVPVTAGKPQPQARVR